MSSVGELALRFLLFTAVIVVAGVVGFVIIYRCRRRQICPACKSREFDAKGRCIACGRKLGEGFEVITEMPSEDKDVQGQDR